jgi:tetratricopeptide (TPR) repeat protein
LADHPSLAELRRFILGEADPQETKSIVQHLAGGCEVCAAHSWVPRTRHFDSRAIAVSGLGLEARDRAAESDRYDAALDAVAARCAQWQAQATEARRSYGQHLRSVRAGKARALDLPAGRFNGLSLVLAYIDLANELRGVSTEQMFQATFLAHVAAQGLPAELYGQRVVADHQAWAMAEMANALRVRDDLDGAWRDIRHAKKIFAAGSGEPFLQAHLDEIEAAIRADRRDVESAVRLLERSYKTYMSLGEKHFAGRALIAQAIHTDVTGDTARAMAILKRATELIDPDRDPRLAASAQQNFLYFLTQSEQYHAAAAYLLESGLRKKLENQPLSLARLRWVEGQILRGLGHLQKAEAAFETARATFREHDGRYNAALVGLELAEVWSRQGRQTLVRDIAAETLRVFEDLGVQREARVAVQFLRATCHIQHALPAVTQRVNRFLTRLEVQPELVFEQYLAASGS